MWGNSAWALLTILRAFTSGNVWCYFLLNCNHPIASNQRAMTQNDYWAEKLNKNKIEAEASKELTRHASVIVRALLQKHVLDNKTVQDLLNNEWIFLLFGIWIDVQLIFIACCMGNNPPKRWKNKTDTCCTHYSVDKFENVSLGHQKLFLLSSLFAAKTAHFSLQKALSLTKIKHKSTPSALCGAKIDDAQHIKNYRCCHNFPIYTGCL